MDKLYYDDNDRILWVEKEDGTKFPVYTLANLNGQNTRITDSGTLEVYNSHTEKWEVIRDEYGYPVSLTGPQGPPGKDGKDGSAGKDSVSYSLDLSNDMDLIYVPSASATTVEHTLTISTGCTVYENGEIANASEWDISVITPNFWPEGASYTVTPNSEIIFTFPQGTVVPLVLYTCTIIASSQKSTIRKEFKIKRACGLEDYDLYIPYSYFKIYTDGSVFPTELPIRVKKKDIGTPSPQVLVISPLDLPTGYSIKYLWIGGGNQTLNTEHISAKSNIVETDLLIVSLYHEEDEIDLATIEVISSGQNGKSTLLIELSNDFDLLFITPNGGAVPELTFEFEVALFEGTTQLDINAFNVHVDNPDSQLFDVRIADSTLDTNSVSVIITPIGTTFSGSATYKFPISVGNTKKIFTLIQLQGSIDYDLVLEPAFIKAIKSDDGSLREYLPGQFSVKISLKEVGTGESERVFIDTLPSGYSIAWKIDQEYQTESLEIGTPYNIPIPEGLDALPSKITVELNYTYWDEALNLNKTITIDRAESAIYADGLDGAPGESSVYLDFSNDYDLIYRVNGVLLDNLEFTSDVYVFKGSNKVTLNEDMALSIVDDGSPKFGVVSIEPDYTHNRFIVKIVFAELPGSPEEGIEASVLGPDVKSLPFKFQLSYLSEDGTYVDLYHTVKIAVLNSAHNYDIYANKYQIAKDGAGNLKDTDALLLEVRHTDLSLEGNSFSRLTTLEDLEDHGLVLKYVVDNGSDYTTVQTSDLSIGTEILKTILNTLWVELWENNTLRDLELFRVVQDGANAVAYYVDLSNDMDLVYLNHNREVIEDIKVESDIRVYNGSQDVTHAAAITISREHDLIYEERLQLVDGKLEVLYKKDAIIPTGVQSLNYIVTAVVDSVEISKKFKVHVFVGDVSYDLRTSTSIIRKDLNNVFTPSEIRVYIDKSLLSNTKSSEKGVDWAAENLTAYYTVNDNPTTTTDLVNIQLAAGEYYASIPISSSIFGSSTHPSLQIYLEDSSKLLIDHVSIEVLHDGKDGQDGKDGKDGLNASGYLLDFDNDADLIYIDSSNCVYADLTITTSIKGFKGTVPLTASVDFLIVEIKVDGNPLFVSSNASSEVNPENNCYDVLFTTVPGALVPEGTNMVTYTISAVFEGSVPVTKRYKIGVFKGNTDYDLQLSSTRLRLALPEKTITPGSVSVSVKKTELGTNSASAFPLLTTGAEFLAENLSVKYAYVNNSNVQTLISKPIGDSTWKPCTGSFSTSSYTDITKCVVVALFNTSSNTCIDYAILDILSDGEKGDPGQKGDASEILQSKNGNSHIFYLNTLKLILLSAQSVSFEFEQVKGGTVQEFSGSLSCTSLNSGDIAVSTSGNKVTFSTVLNKTYTPGVYLFTVKDTAGRSVSISITLAVGTTVYDLVATPTYVHYNPANKEYEDIVFSVYTECYGGGYFEESEVTSGFTLRYSSATQTNSTEIETTKSYTDDNNVSTTRYFLKPSAEESITVNCYKDNVLLDFVILPVVRDGAPGTLEATVLSIKDENNNEVGGMSGVNSVTVDGEAEGSTVTLKDNILLWGGGNHKSAIGGNTAIALTKNGTGSRIGPLTIYKSYAKMMGASQEMGSGESYLSGRPWIKFDSSTAAITAGFSGLIGTNSSLTEATLITISPAVSINQLTAGLANTEMSVKPKTITEGDGQKQLEYTLTPTYLIDTRDWYIPEHTWTFSLLNLKYAYFGKGILFDSISVYAVTDTKSQLLKKITPTGKTSNADHSYSITVPRTKIEGKRSFYLKLVPGTVTRRNSANVRYLSDLNDNVFNSCTVKIKPSKTSFTCTTESTTSEFTNTQTIIGNDGLVINNGSAAIGIYLDPGKGLVLTLNNIIQGDANALSGQVYVDTGGYLRLK